MYDIDRNGNVSKDEFRQILSAFLKIKEGITLSNGKSVSTVEEIIEEFFTDDEEITFTRFKEIATKNPEIMKSITIL